MRRLLLLALLLLSPVLAQAQQQALVVQTCGLQALTVGGRGILYMDTTGNLCSSTGGGGGSVTQGTSPWVVSPAVTSHASTTALGTSLIVKASAGNLGAYNCTAVTGGAAGYCVAYNSTTVPAPGALTGSLVLDFCYFTTTARGCALSRLPNSIVFGTGIVILATSAVDPYTYTTGVDTVAIEADYF